MQLGGAWWPDDHDYDDENEAGYGNKDDILEMNMLSVMSDHGGGGKDKWCRLGLAEVAESYQNPIASWYNLYQNV